MAMPGMNWMTPRTVAEILGVNRRTITNLCQLRRMPHHRVGRSIRITQDQLEQFKRATEVKPR